MSKQALLIFARNPAMGKVKTRLAATIGNEAALAIYHQLLQHTVSATGFLPFDRFVYYSDYIQQQDIWNNKFYNKQVQQGNDLGTRMKNAFTSAFQQGYNQVVIIGTDCAELSSAIIVDAFNYLQTFDVVIGPAEDGGYYLLGMKQLHPGLFNDIKWSTNAVFRDTIQAINTLQLSYRLLPVLNDIDEEKDLRAFKLKQQ